MDLLMQEEVRELVGERSQRLAYQKANRWGSERGYCVVMGRRFRWSGRACAAPMTRKCVRAATNCSIEASR
jgi:hypothetical protein